MPQNILSIMDAFELRFAGSQANKVMATQLCKIDVYALSILFWEV